MALFLVDEDMPRSTARVLREAGHQAEDVRDVGLRGHGDDEVFDYAQRRGAILVTEDRGFANVIRFPLGSHRGIIVLRVPNELSTSRVNRELLEALAGLQERDLAGSLLIVQPGRFRLRRHA